MNDLNQLFGHDELREQIAYLTKELVKIPSVSHTNGEKVIADRIKQWISQFPYFKQHPDHLWEQDIPGDPYGRKNIFAWIQANPTAKKTVIYHSHIDTVNVKDFGNLENIAFDSEQLGEFFKNYDHDETIKIEAQSGDWMFGRGVLDMKSGAAIHIANLHYFSENLDKLHGNVLAMFNPDEETQHIGIISAISELTRLQKEYDLEYICAINNDFTSPLFEGDSSKYIYTGFAGKLLPSFFIYGREVHVGETLKGIDSTLVASEINKQINNNMALAEQIEGEVILPPSCLQQRDRKESYTVQTPFKTGIYFNYFLYKDTPSDVLRKLKQQAKVACDEVEHYLQMNYKQYLQRLGQVDQSISFKIEVVTIEELIQELRGKNIPVERTIRNVAERTKGEELRDRAFKIVEALQELDEQKKPRVILFFSPPYCPNHSIQYDREGNEQLIKELEQLINDVQNKTKEEIKMKEFFPFLADSSYIACQESKSELDVLMANFIGWDETYSLPIQEIQALNIPSINIGVYGKDGHKWTERVYKPYSFELVPHMIRTLTEKLLLSSDRSLFIR